MLEKSRMISQALAIKSRKLEGFFEDCRAMNLAPHTIETYKGVILEFLDFVGDPLKIDDSKLRDFLIYLRKKELSQSSLKGIFSALSSYYNYLAIDNKIDSGIISRFRSRYIKGKKQYNGDNSRQLISIDEMKGLIELTVKEKDVLIGNMLLFLGKTGIRRGELIAMDIQDINLDRGEFIVKPKRKRGNRLGFFDHEVCVSLREYLKWREPRAKDNALWISPNDGKRVSKNYVYHGITSYARITGLHNPNGALNQKFTPHCTRHFFTTHMRRAGMSREFIKELRGDSKYEAIDIYDHIDTAELKEAYLRYVPKLLKEEEVSCQIKVVKAVKVRW